MEENGYLDRVAKWEMNQVRLIGNKAVHENFISKEDAWNQYNYLEDILKLVSEKHPVGGKRKGGAGAAERSGAPGCRRRKAGERPRKKMEKRAGTGTEKRPGQGKSLGTRKVWK